MPASSGLINHKTLVTAQSKLPRCTSMVLQYYIISPSSPLARLHSEKKRCRAINTWYYYNLVRKCTHKSIVCRAREAPQNLLCSIAAAHYQQAFLAEYPKRPLIHQHGEVTLTFSWRDRRAHHHQREKRLNFIIPKTNEQGKQGHGPQQPTHTGGTNKKLGTENRYIYIYASSA